MSARKDQKLQSSVALSILDLDQDQDQRPSCLIPSAGFQFIKMTVKNRLCAKVCA